MAEVSALIAALDVLILEAEMQYHRLMTGRLAVKVVVDGHETEFNRASAASLKAYIAELADKRAALLGCGSNAGAIGFVF